MAIEEEFGIEIPDNEADNIGTVQQGELGSAILWLRRLTENSYRLHFSGQSSYNLCTGLVIDFVLVSGHNRLQMVSFDSLYFFSDAS